MSRSMLRITMVAYVVAMATCGPAFAQRGFGGAADGQALVREELGDYYGLVIGISQYMYWPNLETAAKDARDVARVLREDYGFKDVMLLLDEDATDVAIRDALHKLRKTVTGRDSVLIYFAGHGVLDGGLGYWVPTNGERDSDAHYLEHASIRARLRIDWLSARHVLVVSDSCYAAAMFRGDDRLPKVTPDYIREAVRTPSRQAFASGGLHPVQDRGIGGNSVFCRYFLDALKNPPRAVFVPSDIYAKVRGNVSINAPPVMKVGGRMESQTPMLRALAQTGHQVGGEFVFVRRGAGRRPRPRGTTTRREPSPVEQPGKGKAGGVRPGLADENAFWEQDAPGPAGAAKPKRGE